MPHPLAVRLDGDTLSDLTPILNTCAAQARLRVHPNMGSVHEPRKRDKVPGFWVETEAPTWWVFSSGEKKQCPSGSGSREGRVVLGWLKRDKLGSAHQDNCPR